MSNYLAIATVTATLQKMLQEIVQLDLEGARVTTLRPDNLGRGIPETGVNIFLYQVTPVNWRNADLPGRRSTGELLKRPQIALELNYIFSFYGSEVELEPQRLLGTVVRTFYSRPLLQAEIIQSTIEDGTFWYLRESNLAEQIESIKVVPLSLSTEDLSKIWSIFFQTPLALSLAYQASAVLIESEETPRRALPVREPRAKVIPYKPIINRILSLDELKKVWRATSDKPIVTDSIIKIQGNFLQGEITKVKIGNQEIIPQETDNKAIILDLNQAPKDLLRAGLQGLQVIHYNNSRRIVNSNIFPTVIFPTIKEIEARKIGEKQEELIVAEITILSELIIGKNQKLVLVLNELNTQQPKEYVLKIPPRDNDNNRVSTIIQAIKPGNYLVRLQVDDAESLLTVDLNPNSSTFEQYTGPKVTFE